LAVSRNELSIVHDLEINAGWVSPFHGTIEEAQSFFQHGLAIGKLGVAVSD
jgi:hypothetical protein